MSTSLATVRVLLNLTTEEDRLVTELASQHGHTKTDVVRRALAIQKLYEELAPNGSLEVYSANGAERIHMPW